jgi:hypothetical protein
VSSKVKLWDSSNKVTDICALQRTNWLRDGLVSGPHVFYVVAHYVVVNADVGGSFIEKQPHCAGNCEIRVCEAVGM